MTNKIDSSVALLGRLLPPTDAGRAGASAEKPAAALDPVPAMRSATDTASLQVKIPEDGGSVVDQARVQAVRAALESGSYRLDPDQISIKLAFMEQELSR